MNDATERDKSFEHDVTGYQKPPEPEEVEIRKLNRHERRKRAKLARMLAVKERLEEEAKSSKTKGLDKLKAKRQKEKDE